MTKWQTVTFFKAKYSDKRGRGCNPHNPNSANVTLYNISNMPYMYMYALYTGVTDLRGDGGLPDGLKLK